MPRYAFQRRATAALLDELVRAGFPPETPVEPGEVACFVTVPPEDYDRAAAVVAAHDPAAIDAAAAAEQQADDADRATLRQVVAALAADADRLRDTTVTMSAQVIRNHLARTDDVVAGLLRVLRRRGVI